MRFESIHLPAYGPFTDAYLDLREGTGRREIVYGPNEAGKSSLLRAICDFLFGIHPQTQEDFVHGLPDSHWASPVQTSKQVLPLHTYGLQSRVPDDKH